MRGPFADGAGTSRLRQTELCESAAQIQVRRAGSNLFSLRSASAQPHVFPFLVALFRESLQLGWCASRLGTLHPQHVRRTGMKRFRTTAGKFGAIRRHRQRTRFCCPTLEATTQSRTRT
jgi:hypothetical protein